MRVIWLLVPAIVLIVVGCAPQPPASAESVPVTESENALDATNQLALGILRLEGTTAAVTSAQATIQLPLWETLQSTVALKSQAERLAVIQQIEATLTEDQVVAIAAMELTQTDAQAWLQGQGPAMAEYGQGTGAGRFGGIGETMSEEDRAVMRERFQNMTEEERVEMRVRLQDASVVQGENVGGVALTTDVGVSRSLMRAVTQVLIERGGQVSSDPGREGAPPIQAGAAEPMEMVPSPTFTPEPCPIAVVTLIPFEDTLELIPTSQPAVEDVAVTGTAGDVIPGALESTLEAASSMQPALEWRADADPGPPLTVEVTTNYAEPNPNLEGGLIYKVGGFLHNPTDEVYAVTTVHVTFYDADGFRGAFYAFPPRPGQRGRQGEWIWHGAMEAAVACNMLGPGESCPFIAEIAAQNMASFIVHPDAVVAVWHESVSVTVGDTQIAETGTHYARISGTVNNPNAYPVKNVTVSGALLDGRGQMVSLGSGVVLYIGAGDAANFEIYVEKQPYVRYQVYALAEQDAK